MMRRTLFSKTLKAPAERISAISNSFDRQSDPMAGPVYLHFGTADPLPAPHEAHSRMCLPSKLPQPSRLISRREGKVGVESKEIVGESPALKTALDLLSVVAPTDSSVLILGETGTGKELVARAVHRLSGRSEKPFVKLQCVAFTV